MYDVTCYRHAGKGYAEGHRTIAFRERQCHFCLVSHPPMRVLVLNSGSSSLKVRGFEVCEGAFTDMGAYHPLLAGLVREIGDHATMELHLAGGPTVMESKRIRTHREAVHWIFDKMTESFPFCAFSLHQIDAVGHRMVHGGDRYVGPTRVNETVLLELEKLGDLAPLHNPACLEGIYGARERLGGQIPMVVVFDTAFYYTLPHVARFYALPTEIAERHAIRRYGFHGIAHGALAASYARGTGRELTHVRLITLQLGSGCSITAIEHGQAIDTSMGFSPLEGLMMSTRSGDLDPTIVGYLAEREQVDVAEVERWLNERSGLLGVSGRSGEMRALLQASLQEGDPRAQFAIDLFCYRARKYLGAYLAVLGGADAIIFGGGIGEHAPEVRARICHGMEWCGLLLDAERNRQIVHLAPGEIARISPDHTPITVYVGATDEETWIARETMASLAPDSAV
ncbi:MAG: acetate/propionate family kinase [Nitrospirae bacterium]|nr:MAG: acetate/propionate family kinase [Nitrospirota bacterium]